MTNGKVEITTHEVGSLSEYLAKIQSILKAWRVQPGSGKKDEVEPWYRGQRCDDWTLKPSASRDGWDDRSLFNRFISDAATFTDGPPRRKEDLWEWYFMAQHYELPTRLLDWSEEPLTALHFAIRDMHEDDEASPNVLEWDKRTPTVWVLDPAAMNAMFFGEYSVICPWPGNGTEHWLPDAKDPQPYERGTSQNPLAIHPLQSNRRMVAQHGKFTVHGKRNEPLEEQWLENSSSPWFERLQRIRITNAAIISDELFDLGINKLRLFPELTKLSRHLRRLYKPQKP
jgi:hypothetical protein